jgi:hypothetical protein
MNGFSACGGLLRDSRGGLIQVFIATFAAIIIRVIRCGV